MLGLKKGISVFVAAVLLSVAAGGAPVQAASISYYNTYDYCNVNNVTKKKFTTRWAKTRNSKGVWIVSPVSVTVNKVGGGSHPTYDALTAFHYYGGSSPRILDAFYKKGTKGNTVMKISAKWGKLSKVSIKYNLLKNFRNVCSTKAAP